MSDPRFDGSLDAPMLVNLCGRVELVEPGVADDSVVIAEPVAAITIPAPMVSKSRPPRTYDWAADIDTIPPGCNLEMLLTHSNGVEALELAAEAIGNEYDDQHVRAAAIMLADWNEPSAHFWLDDTTDAGSDNWIERANWVRSVRARFERDWIRMPVGFGKSFVRAEWMKSEKHALSFVLDAMVGVGGIRRTWDGKYYRCDPEDEPWRGHPLREAVTVLLGVMSGTAKALNVQLAASDVLTGVGSSGDVRTGLYYLERLGKVKRVQTAAGVVWTGL